MNLIKENADVVQAFGVVVVVAAYMFNVMPVEAAVTLIGILGGGSTMVLKSQIKKLQKLNKNL